MTQNTTNEQGYAGQAPLTAPNSEFNMLSFLIRQALGSTYTVKVVEVKAVDTAAQTVDVHPLVNMMDGLGNAQAHGTILAIPYFTYQSGRNAVLLHPTVGDRGAIIVCDRDSSAVKEARAEANPGSQRRFDLADSLYIGGFLNDAPDNKIEITNDEVIVLHDTKIVLRAPEVLVDGELKATGEITAKSDAAPVAMTTHQHGNSAPIAGGTTAPTPGT